MNDQNQNKPKTNTSAVIVRVRWSFMEGTKSNREAAGEPNAKRQKACEGLKDSVNALMANLPH